MKTVTRTITPADARAILEKNIGNRALRDSRVEYFVALIRNGQWATTHQGVALAKSGRVLDGQHRLHAIMRSGKSVEVQVTTEMDEELYRWIDSGAPRATHDRIHLVNDTYINQIACSLVKNYLVAARTHGAGRQTVDDVENCFLEMSDSFLFVASSFTSKVRGITLMPVGAAIVSLHHKTQTKGVEFCEMLITGEHLVAGHPVLTLRNALISGRVDSVYESYWKTIYAAKVYAAGGTITGLQAATEDFQGNVYQRLLRERQNAGLKSAVTRKRKEAALDDTIVCA